MQKQVKIFHGDASKLQTRINRWLNEDFDRIIFKINFKNDLNTGKAAALITYSYRVDYYTFSRKGNSQIQIIFGKINKLEKKVNTWIEEAGKIDINKIEFEFTSLINKQGEASSDKHGKSSALIHYYTE